MYTLGRIYVFFKSKKGILKDLRDSLHLHFHAIINKNNLKLLNASSSLKRNYKSSTMTLLAPGWQTKSALFTDERVFYF